MAIHKRLFFLLVFFFPTQLGFHFWPMWASILGRRIDYLSPTVYFTDILIISMLGFWAYTCVVHTRTSRVILKPNVMAAWLAFGIFIVINCIFAVSAPVAIYKWIKVVEYIGLGCYIVYTKVRIADIVFPLALSVGYSSVIACLQFALQHSVGGALWYIGERTFSLDTPGIARFNICPSYLNFCTLVLRPYGTFPHPNVLAGYLSATMPLVIYHLLTGKESFLNTLVYKVILGIGFIALLFTFSRSAWIVTCINICVVGGVVYTAFVTRHGKHISLSRALFFISIPLLLFFVSVTFIPSASEESVVRRIELQNIALRVWQHSPLFGVGLGNFLVEMPSYSRTRQGSFLQPVHNMYLLIFSEIGLIGSFGVLAFCILLVRHMYINFSRVVKMHRYVVMVRILPLFTLLLLGFVDHYPLTLQQGQLIFVFVAALNTSSNL